MKKIVFFSALLSLSLVSCGDDDKPQPQPEPQPQDNTTTLLIGKWNMVTGEVYANGQLVQSGNLSTEGCDYDYFEIKTGGLKDEVYHDEEDCSTSNYPGTWTYESANKMVSLEDEDGYLLEGEIISINATDIKLKLISDGGDRPEDQGFEVFYYLKK